MILVLRICLALVFLASGGSKIATLPRSIEAARRLGVPPSVAPVVGRLLPVVEISVAWALLITQTALVGAIASSVLLIAFTILVVVNLLNGRRPPCACFGGLSSDRPIGVATVVRNVVLAAASGVLVVSATLEPAACRLGCYDRAGRDSLYLFATVVMIAVAAVCVSVAVTLTRLVGQLAERVRALEQGTSGSNPQRRHVDLPSPGHALPGEPVFDARRAQLALAGVLVAVDDGVVATVAEVAHRAGTKIVIFLSEGCGACQSLVDYCRSLPPESRGHLLGFVEAGGLAISHTSEMGWLREDQSGLASTCGVTRFPSALVLDDDARVTGQLLVGLAEIRDELELLNLESVGRV